MERTAAPSTDTTTPPLPRSIAKALCSTGELHLEACIMSALSRFIETSQGFYRGVGYSVLDEGVIPEVGAESVSGKIS